MMIRCRHCGAEYEADAGACPVCGAENRAEKNRAKQEQIREYKKNRHRSGSETGGEGRLKWLLGTAALCVFAVILVLAAKSMIWKNGKQGTKESGADIAAVLEEYYQKGDYQGLYDAYTNAGVSGADYQKYWEVGSAKNWMKAMEETKKALEEPAGSSVYYGISYALSGDCQALKIIDEAVSDGIVRDNEDVLNQFRMEIETFFRETLQLTDQEIGEIKAAAREGKQLDWDSYEENVKQRLGI